MATSEIRRQPETQDPAELVAATVQIQRKAFSTPAGTKEVLAGLDFAVVQGEFLAILGPSGCGKTTLLRILAGLDCDYAGAVRENGEIVSSPSRFRTLLFQEPRLLPWLRVGSNVDFALGSDISADLRRERVSNALDLVGLDDRARAWPHQLSGGMAKRVALARALVNLPRLLLLDEPFSGLDIPAQYALHAHVARIHAANPSMAAVLVTHDIDEAVYLSDRILILSPTHAAVQATVDVALQRPRNRESDTFRAVCAAVTSKVLDAWAINIPQ